MPEFKEYPIRTIEDLIDLVTADNVKAVAADLTDFLIQMAMAKALIKMRRGTTTSYNADFVWIDDGKPGCTTTVRPFGNLSGEEYIISPINPQPDAEKSGD